MEPLTTRVLAVALLASPLFAACGGSGQASGTRSPLIRSLCAVHADAARGDQSGANREYYDNAHQPLHELAADLQRRDRAAAGRLLEAHQRVEDDLAGHPTDRTLTRDLDDLRTRTGDALAATGKPANAACPS